jgi:putative FmdB family regulatory protein
MPTYEYECEECGARFDRHQTFSGEPLTECPQCRGKIRRIISGGAGFVLKGSGHDGADYPGSKCSLEYTGKTCCGRQERCEKPPCGGEQ